ncbi:hypothetical protein [Sphingorhabdus sp.]|uniref:hypothetical protein n=1 Tax=Sphingorhabdus sp. TaxID=1902408 RepID=UPI0039832FB9
MMGFSHAKMGLCLFFLSVAASAPAQNASPEFSPFAIEAEAASYADIADLVVISPLIIDVSVRKVQKVSPEQALAVPATMQRVLIEADVMALIRGEGGITPRVRFVVDIPKDPKGKIPKLKKQRLFLFGRQVERRPGEIQLSRPNALAYFSPANDSLVRDITKEAVELNAPRRIASITSAFHSAGTVLGEGETQIFLKTDNDKPLSLTVLSRPGQQKQWAVSTAEVIDASATAPQRFSLLWYRLACGLPRNLPSERVEGANNENTARAQADYKFVIEALGPCGRKR